MFGWLFGGNHHQPEHRDPPSEKQLAFARKLRIVVPAGIGKADLSELIDEALSQRDARKIARSGKSAQGLPPIHDLWKLKQSWQLYVDNSKWVAIVFHGSRTIRAEVVQVISATIDDGSVHIECESGKIVSEPGIGRCLEQGKYHVLDTRCIIWAQEVGELDVLDVEKYRAAVEAAKKVAAQHT